MKAPDCCPICGETDSWKLIDFSKKGFDAKTAVIGGVLLGAVGLAAGFSGKRKTLYCCLNCGFSHEYDESGKENKISVSTSIPKGYKNTGLNSIYIKIVKNAAPYCAFCGLEQNLYIKPDGSSFRFLCSHCRSEFKCGFTIGGKIKENSMQILSCGKSNINNYTIGFCNPEMILSDKTIIKYN